MPILLMLTQAILLFYGTQIFPLGGRLDKLRFASFGLIILARLLAPDFKLKMPRFSDLIAFAILIFAFASSIYSFNPKVTILRATANLLMYFSIFWVLWISCQNQATVYEYIRALYRVWVLFYGVNVAFLFLRPQDSFQIHEGEFEMVDYQRFNGVTISPNAIGLFSAIILPLAIWMFQNKRNMVSLFLLGSVVFSFFYSFSRDAFICSVLGSSVYFYFCFRKHRTFIVLGAIFLISMMLIYIEFRGSFLPAGLLREDNLMLLGGRIEAWNASFEMMAKHPWRGYGFGVEEFLFERFHYEFAVHSGGTVHNSFLGLALQLGWIPPIVLYGAFGVFLGKSFSKILDLKNEFQPLMAALYASILAGFLTSFFESWLYSVGGILAFPFFMFTMLLMKMFEFEKNKIEHSPPQPEAVSV